MVPGSVLVLQSAEVTFDAVDHAVVAGDLGLPLAAARVVAKFDDVGQLGLERRLELGGGDVVVALLADVGVGARLATRSLEQ